MKEWKKQKKKGMREGESGSRQEKREGEKE
jgi:hypothetical protein